MSGEESGSSKQAIGRRVAQARHEAGGLTQQDLADLIGVSVRMVQAYELGEVAPWRRLDELESALGRSKAWILHGNDSVEMRDQQLSAIELKIDRILDLLSEGK